MKAAAFFTADEKARIETAVREAEARTRGEIVPMVVDASYTYPRAEILGAGLFALALGITLSWAFGNSSIWGFLPIFLLAYYPFKVVIREWPGLKRRLISPAEMAEEVEERALVAFMDKGLHQTREGTGILILLSLFEHRVHVLADYGIHRAASQQDWEHVVALVTAGLQENRACEALCEAVDYCADLLAEQFPPRTDDSDELPNLIID